MSAPDLLLIAPFALVEGGDLTAFASLDALIGYVEPIDVRNGEFTVMDSDGRLVELRAASDTSPVWAVPASGADPEKLRSATLRYIGTIPEGRLRLDRPADDYTTRQLLEFLLQPEPRQTSALQRLRSAINRLFRRSPVES